MSKHHLLHISLAFLCGFFLNTVIIIAPLYYHGFDHPCFASPIHWFSVSGNQTQNIHGWHLKPPTTSLSSSSSSSCVPLVELDKYNVTGQCPMCPECQECASVSCNECPIARLPDQRACTGYFENLPIRFDAASHASCASTRLSPPGFGWRGVPYPGGDYSRPLPNIVSRWTDEPTIMASIFADRMSELLAPADPAPFASLARLFCDPFADRIPRVAFMMTGNARALLDPIVHQTVRRNAIEAFGGTAVLFLDITLEDADSKAWNDVSTARIEASMSERKLHAVLRQFHNSGIEIGGVQIRTSSIAVAQLFYQASRRRMDTGAQPSYTLRAMVTDARPVINDQCRFSSESWLSDPVHADRFLSMSSKIRDAYNMARAFEDAKGVRFDWMVRLRPDLAFFDPVEPFCRYEKDTLHTGHGTDDFFFASRSVSDTFFLLVDAIYYNCTGNSVIGLFDSEQILVHTALAANIQVFLHQSFSTAIIRSTGGCTLNSLRDTNAYRTCAPATPSADSGAALVEGVENYE